LDNTWPIGTNWTIRGPSVQIGQYMAHQYKMDNTWPISTNWTIRGPSVQTGQYVAHQYKLDKTWPISTNWTIRCPSVQINKNFKNHTKEVSRRMTYQNVKKLQLPSTLFPLNSLPVCMHTIRGTLYL
jgi:hypothetical protein